MGRYKTTRFDMWQMAMYAQKVLGLEEFGEASKIMDKYRPEMFEKTYHVYIQDLEEIRKENVLAYKVFNQIFVEDGVKKITITQEDVDL